MITRIISYLRGQVLGLVAIFIALGGTGYAAMSIPRHSVGRRQLKHGAVAQPQLAKRSVGNRQLRTRAVSQRTLAPASVGSRQLRKGSVRGNQLAPGAVSASKLGAGSVGTAQIAAGAVGSGQIGAGAVGAGQIAAGAVGSGQIAAGSVGNAQLAAGSVAPGNLTGIGGYPIAFAIVGPTGVVFGSPTASTSGYGGTGSWSNGNGEVHFQTGLGTNQCIAFSSAPTGNQDGTNVNTTAFIGPTSPIQTTVSVTTQVVGTNTPDVAVWIECVA